MLTDADIAYVEREFVPLDRLCTAAGRDLAETRARIAARELPAPPYPGLEYVPADYFELPDAAAFVSEYTGRDPEDNLAAYLDGTYFVCLRQPTPEVIVRKGELVDELRELIAEPRESDAAWREALRARVDELDGLERPFSPDYDRVRFERPPTRDELIADPRRRWPQAF
jgi:Family of unknown function (DUF6058)